MNVEQEKVILVELINALKKDLQLGLKNLAVKSSIDIKNKVFELLQLSEDNFELVKEGKKFVMDSTDVIVNELQVELNRVLDNYIDQ